MADGKSKADTILSLIPQFFMKQQNGQGEHTGCGELQKEKKTWIS